jgi:spore germination cell wall hydrolase CwlJ-like protein
MALLLLLPTSADAVPYAKQAKCFADNLHYEARGESLAGIKAVANVVLNRVKSKRWPNTICQVVYQRKQFSWANYARDRHPTGVAYTTQVMRVVALAMAGRLRDNTQTATHYHTLAVSPSWNKRLVKIKVIGFHVFYRYPFKRKGTEWKHTPKGMLMDIEIN